MKKIDELFSTGWRTVGYIAHARGYSTSTALSLIVSDDVLVIAPKVLHSAVKKERPDVRVVSPEWLVRHSGELDAKVVLHMWAANHRAVSIVYERL